ncbi:DEAD/DEAH box helicase [Thioploca ingrica]|uniref:DEAD/DEAH box helicase n=1 Tax=Thioploca ingrica TaxID=40754 RepID=A0A090AJR2_9GAMM|nr:DEAD/DEAH box helicase [Thioploca ingrica]
MAKLCAEVTATYKNSAMRTVLQDFLASLDKWGKIALERYIRINYDEKRVLIWPSQRRGIERLVQGNSFALCTPTGSGKTTVAKLAIIQSLFNQANPNFDEKIAPLAIYLVSSRALAVEVEIKFNRVFRRIHKPNVQVTGLYGGTDWGPTDAWLTTEEPTVLICTYEKAEALIRFLGVPFLYRVSLIIVDEAHSVQFNGQSDQLQQSESRSLRLESLINRLLTHLERKSRVIALSAVAAGAEDTIAQWITGHPEVQVTQIHYRSTRQLVGRLECLPHREFQIYYDLLDNASLQFEDSDHKGSPFVPKPFPACPPAPNLEEDGIEKQLRPYLFWAAMHLAAPDDQGQQRAVLISVTQGIWGYAKDLLQLIEETWNNIEEPTLFKELSNKENIEKPTFFKEPTDKNKLNLWRKCLQACKDYYSERSREYRLLQKGIVVHHGKMPGLMARLLIEVIQERIVHLVLATSTLSEGVNLPFETVLIPTLRRGQKNISVQEFNNLIGRTGRPGFGTEGRGLVLLHPQSSEWNINNSRDLYFKFIKELKERKAITDDTNAKSPLAELLILIKEKWQELTKSTDENEFMMWLETTAPLTLEEQEISPAVESLDTLDSILLSNLVEIEQISNSILTSDELEDALRRVWQKSYAYYATQQEIKWENIFIRRGKSLNTNIYPNFTERKRLYHTNLPPRAGKQLLNKYQDIVNLLKQGEEYALYDDDKKFEYISTVVNSIKELPKFNFSKEEIGKSSWKQILRWWLNPSKSKWPSETKVSDWHQYISQNLIYRFNWGLGSVIALAMDDAHKDIIIPLSFSLDDWPQTGLPWIVFWLKELITWGTLEPVAAYLLAKGIKFTRADAQTAAQEYYKQVQAQPPNEQLDARTIRNWTIDFYKDKKIANDFKKLSKDIKVELLRDFSKTTKQFFRVIPIEKDNKVCWLDPGGFPLAICDKTNGWDSNYLNIFDFKLDPIKKLVLTESYI